MNSFERFHRRLAGEPVDRPPNFDIFMTFAAHHIGEPLSLYYQDYRVLVDANLAVVRDFDVDMEAAAAQFGDRVSFCGNFDPVAVMLQGTPSEVYRATTRCMRFGGPRSFSGAGCEIPLNTPHANLHAQARALREV